MSEGYAAAYAAWQADPEGFWEKAAEQIDWTTPAEKTFDADAGTYGRWFAGATCNT